MVVVIDVAALRAYHNVKGATFPGRLWLLVDGLDRHQRASATAAIVASGPPNGAGWRFSGPVEPTAQGTLVNVSRARWRAAAEFLAAELDEAGYGGRITTCPIRMDVFEEWTERSHPPVPTALMQFKLDPNRPPATTAGGLGSPNWNVRPADTVKLVQTLVAWGFEIGGPAQIGITEPARPLTAADAFDLVGHRIHHGPKTFAIQFTEDPGNPLSRIRRLDFHLNGNLGVQNIDPRHDASAAALELIEPIAALADILAAALVRPMDYNYSGWNHYVWRYGVDWHEWENTVLRPEAIQLMTRRQIERAHDLSKWQVTQLGADRYLVRATDIRPWFDAPPDVVWRTESTISTSMRVSDQVPGPALTAQALADFGDALREPTST